MAESIIHRLELVEVDEEHCRQLLGSTTAKHRVIEPLEEQRAVWQASQRVVQGELSRTNDRVVQVFPRLGVVQVRGRDVRQRLRALHRRRIEPSATVSVQIEGTELLVAVAQRKGEDSREACLQGSRRKPGEAHVPTQIRDRDGMTGFVRLQARPLTELRLQPLELQGRVVRRCQIARSDTWGNDGHTGGRDRQHVNDSQHQVIENALDWEVRHQCVRELAKYF